MHVKHVQSFIISFPGVQEGEKNNFTLLFINILSPFWFKTGNLLKPVQFRSAVSVVRRQRRGMPRVCD